MLQKGVFAIKENNLIKPNEKNFFATTLDVSNIYLHLFNKK
jgi:hypothetical protein